MTSSTTDFVEETIDSVPSLKSRIIGRIVIAFAVFAYLFGGAIMKELKTPVPETYLFDSFVDVPKSIFPNRIMISWGKNSESKYDSLEFKIAPSPNGLSEWRERISSTGYDLIGVELIDNGNGADKPLIFRVFYWPIEATAAAAAKRKQQPSSFKCVLTSKDFKLESTTDLIPLPKQFLKKF